MVTLAVPPLAPQLDDIEAETTYLLIREERPETVVEISPCGGWSTSWILNALRDNKHGQLYSYDIVDYSTRVLPKQLTEGIWHFVRGDVRDNIGALPSSIEYLFMDSDHSADFARWYITKVFPTLRSGTPVSIHDVFGEGPPIGEGKVVTDWLRQNGLDYFSASRRWHNKAYRRIMSAKRESGTAKQIHCDPARRNSMVFFRTA